MIWTIAGLALGTAAFIFMIIFEVIKCKAAVNGKEGKNPWLLLGIIFLSAGWIISVVGKKTASVPVLIAGIIILVIGLVLYYLVLKKTSSDNNYTHDSSARPVLSSGIYGRVRHPGLWCFIIIAVGAGMIFPETIAVSIYFALMNIGYIYIQDRIFFPVYLEGYEEYKKQVPFCFPKIIRGK